jgi:carbon-monoxide dehydrogenase iron sulfur subunit
MKKQKKIIANEEVCIGCRLCEVYCLTAHSQSKDLIKAFLRESPRAIPRIRVQEKGLVSFALQCRHCPDTPCVTACISGAMQKREDGLTFYQSEKCVGCWSCVLVCPYGAIRPNENEKKLLPKCDFCLEIGTPACVENCPNEALRIIEVKESV